MGTSLSDVLSIMGASAGCKVLVKQSTVQQPYWRAKEAEYRTFELAESSLAPTMKEHEARLTASDMAAVEPTIRNLPFWAERMRPGSTKALEKLVLEKSKGFVEALLQAASIEPLCEFRKTLDFGARMLPAYAKDFLELAGKAEQFVVKHQQEEVAKTIDGVLGAFSQDMLGVPKTSLKWDVCST